MYEQMTLGLMLQPGPPLLILSSARPMASAYLSPMAKVGEKNLVSTKATPVLFQVIFH